MRKLFNNNSTRLRYSLDSMSNDQRKAIRLPHVGEKEIARGNKLLDAYGLRYQLVHGDRALPVPLKHWNKVSKHKGVYIV